MNVDSQEKDQQANPDSFQRNCETPSLRQGPARSRSASSSSSFDSCSDLLGSLENAAESFDEPRILPHIDNKEADGKNDGSCCQASPQSECLQASPSFKNCEGIMKGDVSSPQDLKNEVVTEEAASQKEPAYGLSSAISLSRVRFLAENTVDKFSQLQTSLRLPTRYIFPLKNSLQANNVASQTVVATDAYDMHGEHTIEKGLKIGESADDTGGTGTRILQSKQFREAASMPDEDMVGEECKLDDVQTEDMLIQNDTQEHAVTSAESSVGEKNLDNSVAYAKETKLISEASDGDTVASVAAGNSNDVANIDASLLEESRSPDIPALTSSEKPKQLPEGDPGSHNCEASLLLSDLRTNSSALSHPLRTFSSGSGRPDLEEVDEGKNEAGQTRAKEPSDVPISVDSFLNVESLSSTKNAPMSKGSDLDNVPKSSKVHQPPLYMQNETRSAWICTDEGAEHGHPSLIGTAERVNSQCDQCHRLEDQDFGSIPYRAGQTGLSFSQSNKSEKSDNYGPDELCRYVENLELNENYVDTVLDMEDVLLNRDEASTRESFLLACGSPLIGTPRSSRDGSMSSSTSGFHAFASGESIPFVVDWVEVVGAKQKRGGSSFGERIVGVKDHTVYCIKVSSCNQDWEVLRRYRDFVDLYYQLRRKFNFRKEMCLPSPWKDVERDSRRIFGSTHPNVVEVRSSRIEKCLQSLLQAGPPLSMSAPLCWFLCPQSRIKGLPLLESQHLASAAGLPKGLDVQLGSLESPHLQSPRSELGSHRGELDSVDARASLGKTVKLDLRTHPNKSIKLLLSAQHYSCAGCYKHLETERGLMHGFVQTLGWGKPRLCEYSGQLFCSSCHLNESAVLPAQVLWHWNFTPGRVSQLAKAYLESIYDQPMLCVSAVNPYLYSKVPILSHVKETRRKLSKMLACILCPFHARIFQTMGSRRYLMENNDFFALRDLEDLSKGAFAVLPSLLKAVLENLKLHITKQCSICAETGEWCGAGVLCEEPFSPIFAFEEDNMKSCKLCQTAFHKACFSRFSTCPACSDNQNNKFGALGMLDQSQMEGFLENHRDVKLLLQGEGSSASGSLAGTDVQSGFEVDRQAHTNKTWPSLYNLLPNKRLWHAFGI